MPPSNLSLVVSTSLNTPKPLNAVANAACEVTRLKIASSSAKASAASVRGFATTPKTVTQGRQKS